MKRSISLLTFAGAAVGAAAPASAADLSVNFDIPRLTVAEYHAPFVSIWIENPTDAAAPSQTLAVWYKPNHEKWLKDMRQWWRRSGRELQVPVDGLTSATRPVGKHKLAFSDAAKPLGKLPAGDYKLVVEAARESGGRELISVPFQWPPAKAQQLAVQGSSELGEITLELKP